MPDSLSSFDQIDTRPCLVLEYSTKSATLALLAAIAERIAGIAVLGPTIWLTYATMHERVGVDQVAAAARNDHGLEVQPVLTP